MKKLFLSLALAVVAMCASAAVGDTFSVGDLSYKVQYNATTTSYAQVEVTGLSTAGKSASNLNLTIPTTVTYNGTTYAVSSVAVAAFANNANIVTVNLKYGIQTIYKDAFKNCTNIKTLRIPSSTTTIIYGAFLGCSALKNVYIANSDPESCAFNGLPVVAGMVLYVPKTHENTVERYSRVISSGQSVSIVKSSNAYDVYCDDGALLCVTSSPTKSTPGEMCVVGFNKNGGKVVDGELKPTCGSGYYNFSGYNYKLTAIADSACLNNTDLKRVNFSQLSYLEEIKSSAFDGCTNLATANIDSKSLKYVRDWAFKNTGIQTMNLPAKVRNFSELAVQGCKKLASFTVDAANEYYSVYKGILYDKLQWILKRCPEGYPSTELYESQFPATLQALSYSSFSNCDNLKVVFMHYGLISIYADAFNNCRNLQTVKLPSTVTRFGNRAFLNCSNLEILYVNAKTPPKLYQSNTFGGTKKTRLYVPYESINAYKSAEEWNTWEMITQGAFDIGLLGHYSGTDSQTVLYGSGYTITSDEEQTINGVTYAGSAMLTSQSSTTFDGTLTIPSAVTEKASNKQYAVTAIGSKVCHGVMDGSMTLKLGENVDSICDYAFLNVSNLVGLKVNARLKSIGIQAFYNCKIAGSIDLPIGFKTLRPLAFYFNKLTHFLIPSTTTIFGSNALRFNTALKELVINSPHWANYDKWDLTFVESSCRVYVPTGCVKQYQNNPVWGRFNLTAGAYDFTYGDIPMNETPYHMTVTSTTPVTVDGVTYAGKAKYVYHPANATAPNDERFIPSNSETYNLTGDKYLMVELGDSLLYGASTFKSMPINRLENLECIGSYAFTGSGITKFTVPSTVTLIKKSAFVDCKSLKELLIMKPLSKISWTGRFYGGNADDFQCYVYWRKYPNFKSSVEKWTKLSGETKEPIDHLNSYFQIDEDYAAVSFSVAHPVDWAAAGLNAYTIYAYQQKEQKAYTRKVTASPASTGLLVDGFTKGKLYRLNRPTATPAATTNLLVGTAENTVNVYDVNVGFLFSPSTNVFWKPTKDYDLGTGNAYLQLPSSIAGSTTKIEVDRWPQALKGDVDANGVVNVSDITALVNKILGTASYSDSACDIDGNGELNVSDVTALVNMILAQ